MTVKKADELLAALKRGEIPERAPVHNFGGECNILLKNRGNPAALTLAGYRAGGGYGALAKALTTSPDQLRNTVKESMLRGRGGAGFPTGVKWGFLPKGDDRPVYLVCNADEGEPGTFKDRQIMEYDPHLLIEGIAIAAHAIGSKRAFIYIRGEFSWIATILEQAIGEAKAAGLLAHVDIGVHKGAGAYVCGEETALLESLEGKRGEPRDKPPFPASVGLYGCPTIINNVETLACLPYIVVEGPEKFKAIGSPSNSGPKIYGVSGHVNKPGAYEYPLGTSLDRILEAAGGVAGTLKAVIVGGLSVPILKAEEAAGLKMDYDGCLAKGTMLGSGGVIVMNESTSIPAVALRAMEFYAHESCGQCVPCREGSRVVLALLRRLLGGRGNRRDMDLVLETCGKTKGLTLCPMGDAWAIPIEAMVAKFRGEFDALAKY